MGIPMPRPIFICGSSFLRGGAAEFDAVVVVASFRLVPRTMGELDACTRVVDNGTVLL